MFDTVLFDLDGTLADTAMDLTDALNYVLALYDKPTLDYQAVRPYAAFGSAKLIQLGFGNDNNPELKTLLLDYYRANIAVHTKLFPGINSVIQHFNQSDINFGIVTNKPKRFTEPLLVALKVKTPCVISGDSYANAKPHPEPLLKACEFFGTKPETTLFIGDAIADVQAANAAKMPVIVAKYGYWTENDDITKWNIYATIDKPIEIIGLV